MGDLFILAPQPSVQIFLSHLIMFVDVNSLDKSDLLE